MPQFWQNLDPGGTGVPQFGQNLLVEGGVAGATDALATAIGTGEEAGMPMATAAGCAITGASGRLGPGRTSAETGMDPTVSWLITAAGQVEAR